jgi:predicted Zn-dependent protease
MSCRVPAPRLVAATIGLVVVLAFANAAGAASSATRSPAVGRNVHLLAFGGFSRSDASRLARHIAATLGVKTDVLGSARLPASAFDPKRRQYVAEKLFPLLRERRGSARSADVVIGLLKDDMYTSGVPAWRFAFGVRSQDGLAVVSQARMDPRLLGLTPDPALRMRRLQKMVVREVGVFALGLGLNRNPRSVLYDTILSTDDLDLMTEEVRPAAPSGARQAWLRRSTAVCDRGVVEGKALIARSPLATPADYLAFLAGAIALEEKHRAALAAVPAASGDRAAVKAMLTRFRRSIEADRSVLAKLSAHWEVAVVKRSTQDGLRVSLRLKTDALELGSTGCARYFDPATYG